MEEVDKEHHGIADMAVHNGGAVHNYLKMDLGLG